ncbi:MAG: TetR/AcrR family transcriptional regulator [Pseudomonadales bacterium]|nr:TetR/AcrR family transcriptional regulator [Pseudomonadales bacterium]
MAKRGEERREKILQVAESIVLQKGFSTTSIDDILQQAHITKGGFFYHFQGKSELAKALVERYLDADDAFFLGLKERAQTLSEEPLQQMLIFLNLMAEAMENLDDVHPGCLVASFTYESQQIDEEVKQLIVEGMLRWRRLFFDMLEKIIEVQPPRLDVDLNQLADMLSSTLEGGILLSRVLNNKMVLVQQIQQYRNHIRLLFS